ncbi:hypothetical protein [Streptomyces sp. NPDC002602]|uniref:hypothetical protein n=1 Tax=Streptomyces sp. NPDC002602 TaxID=3364654 RepID=UPI00369BDA37
MNRDHADRIGCATCAAPPSTARPPSVTRSPSVPPPPSVTRSPITARLPSADRPRRRSVRTAALVALLLLLAGGTATGCGGRATTHHKPGTSHEQASGDVGTLLDAQDGAGHRLRQVPAQGAPEVRLTTRPDSEDGWNLQLGVKNFRFTPDSVGGAALPGAGHAHLELDGRKLARAYGPWYHLSAAQVPEGAHTLTVRLYADDHTAWAVGGKAVEATAELTGGPPGQGSHSHATPTPTAPPQATRTPQPAQTPRSSETPDVDRTVTVTVRDGKVVPAPGRVEVGRGERVALRVTSDRADTLHVHGYDKELALPAGQEATLILTADRTGLFEVETHESDLVLTQLLVR